MLLQVGAWILQALNHTAWCIAFVQGCSEMIKLETARYGNINAGRIVLGAPAEELYPTNVQHTRLDLGRRIWTGIVPNKQCPQIS